MDHRKTEFYRRIVALGGRIPDQTTWRMIGQLCGYTARSDIAGFFGAASRRWCGSLTEAAC